MVVCAIVGILTLAIIILIRRGQKKKAAGLSLSLSLSLWCKNYIYDYYVHYLSVVAAPQASKVIYYDCIDITPSPVTSTNIPTEPNATTKSKRFRVTPYIPTEDNVAYATTR